jgi:cell division protein ZapA (FtsZ GTPase activity inhibitor)
MKNSKIRYMKELLPEERKWLIRAVVRIMLSDDIIDEMELVFLNKLSRVFHDNESNETIDEIATLIRKKQSPELEKLRIADPEHIIFMLNILVSSIFANEKKIDEEVKNYFLAGLKLGMTYDILTLKLAYQKERFRIKMLQKEIDEDIRKLTANWIIGE